MPSRGGKREGKPGKAYSNRTDLNHALPITTVPGGYGSGVQQIANQRAVPMGTGVLPQGQNVPQAPSAPSQPAQPAPLTALDAPTQRPGESLMTGVNAGPGAGSEALATPAPADPVATALSLLNTLGTNISPQVAYIRNALALQQQNQSPF